MSAPPSNAPSGESRASPDDEISAICQRTFQQPDAQGVLSRTFHRKTHALLKARVVIHGDLPESAAHGLFAGPAAFEAWARFSSSLFASDWMADARGLAVKLLGVSGAPCSEKTAGEQDFVMINQPAFLFADEREALEYFRIMDGRRTLTPFNIGPPRYVFPSLNPARARWRFVWLMLDTVKQCALCRDLSRLTYFSATPYRLGDGAMKFSFAPQSGPRPRLSGSFRNRLKQRLAAGPMRFDIRVQPRTAPDKEPIDDAMRPWISPFIPVGEMEIRPQEFDTEERDALAERISFSPWNCLKSHEPLGSVNRLRRTAYRDAAERRSATCPFHAAR